MQNIFVIICSIIMPVFSLNEIKSNICVNCRFFTKSFILGNQYGRCCLFPKTEIETDLVTGIKKEPEYQFCSIARHYDDMCGKEGKKYIKK
jgi:hypothetical protein